MVRPVDQETAALERLSVTLSSQEEGPPGKHCGFSTGRDGQDRVSRLSMGSFESFCWALGHRLSLVVWYRPWGD